MLHAYLMIIIYALIMMSGGMIPVTTERKRKRNAVRIPAMLGETIIAKMVMSITIELAMIKDAPEVHVLATRGQMSRRFRNAGIWAAKTGSANRQLYVTRIRTVAQTAG